jgi:tetratricopeptide (TPR) repeat protein
VIDRIHGGGRRSCLPVWQGSCGNNRQGRLLPRVLIALKSLCLAIIVANASAASSTVPDFDAAVSLFNARRYPEAREVFEKILTTDPKNAAAHHYLGRTIAARNNTPALEEAVVSLARAVELAPNNATYLGIFGGTSLQLAGRTNSISAATKGRDAMEKALTIDPDYLVAREGLFQFYQRAPWPLGSSAKAARQLAEIRKRDPDLATILGVVSKTNAKEFDAAFKLCEDVLQKQPDNYTALYHFGRTASISGKQLDRGLACLQRCLSFEPPTPASPTHSHAWQRIGNIQEQLQRPAEARTAYEAALKLDPSNRQASDALARLKQS